MSFALYMQFRKYCWSISGHFYYVLYFSNTVDVCLNPKFPKFVYRDKVILFEMEISDYTQEFGHISAFQIILQVRQP